jgi:hypothetical protein
MDIADQLKLPIYNLEAEPIGQVLIHPQVVEPSND